MPSIFSSPFAPRTTLFQDPTDTFGGIQPSGIFNPLPPASDVGVNQRKPIIPSERFGRASDKLRIRSGSLENGPLHTPTPEVKTEDLDAYRGFLRGQEPQRRDYELGKWGKALSLVAGAAEGYTTGPTKGVELGMGLLQRPYREAMEDWQTKGARLKGLADLDVAERAYRTELMKADREHFLKEKEHHLKALETVSQLSLNETYEAQLRDLMDNRWVDIHYGDDGYTYLTDKMNGTSIQVGKSGLTVQDKEKAMQIEKFIDNAYQEGRIRLTGEEQRATERERGAQERETEKFKAGLPKPVDVQDIARARELAATDVQNTNPELFNRVYRLNSAGTGYEPNPNATPEDLRALNKRREIRQNQILGKEPMDPITDDGRIPETDIRRITLRRSAVERLKNHRDPKTGELLPIIIDKATVDDMERQLEKAGYGQPGSTSVPSRPTRTTPRSGAMQGVTQEALDEMRKYGYAPPPGTPQVTVPGPTRWPAYNTPTPYPGNELQPVPTGPPPSGSIGQPGPNAPIMPPQGAVQPQFTPEIVNAAPPPMLNVPPWVNPPPWAIMAEEAARNRLSNLPPTTSGAMDRWIR